MKVGDVKKVVIAAIKTEDGFRACLDADPELHGRGYFGQTPFEATTKALSNEKEWFNLQFTDK